MTDGLVFTADKGDFADAVAWAAKTLPARATTPILNGVLIVGEQDNGLIMSAYDFETSGSVKLPAEVKTPGAVLVSGRLLANIAALLPNKPVEFAVEDAEAVLKCGAGKFTLRTMMVDDYPELPQLPEETGVVETQVFADAVAQVVSAASKDDATPMLTGVRMELLGNKVRLVATDRFRLAVRELAWSPTTDDVEAAVLIPAKTLAEIGRNPDGTEMFLALGGASEVGGKGLFGVNGDNKRSTARLLDAEFPAYERLLPETYTSVAVIDSQELNSAVKRVSLVCDRGAQLKFQFTEDTLTLMASADELGEAQEDIGIVFSGEPLTIAFNPEYLCDGLTALHSTKIQIGFVSASKPAVLQSANGDEPSLTYVPADFTYVLMPVRLS